MNIIKEKDIPALRAQKIQPVIFSETLPKSMQVLDDPYFAQLAAEVEERKKAAAQKGA